MEKFQYTFSVSHAVGEHGHEFPVLTANEYPWMNIQIVPTAPHQRDMILKLLQGQGHTIAEVEGRQDFVAIQAGGGTPEHPTIEITAQNYRQVSVILRECLKAGAEWWAKEHELVKP